jgi:hypothetical protein
MAVPCKMVLSNFFIIVSSSPVCCLVVTLLIISCLELHLFRQTYFCREVVTRMDENEMHDVFVRDDCHSVLSEDNYLGLES